MDGARLNVSTKTDLKAGMVGTGQASPREEAVTHRRLGASVTKMLEAALTVRVSVPATWLLIHVAAGRMEAFCQWGQVRSGLLAGMLLVSEAGGVITDARGRPWTLDSLDFLAAAPGVHDEAVAALAAVAV